MEEELSRRYHATYMDREIPEKPSGEPGRGLRRLGAEAKRQPTPAERIPWSLLRNRRLARYKFRQQHRIGMYRVDFYCPAGKLVIELDGPIHDSTASEDTERQQYLERFAYRFLRFKNEEVIEQRIEVLDKICRTLDA
jgi:very-short-patch-repair endonuclease